MSSVRSSGAYNPKIPIFVSQNATISVNQAQQYIVPREKKNQAKGLNDPLNKCAPNCSTGDITRILFAP